jgi:hypothetical protein
MCTLELGMQSLVAPRFLYAPRGLGSGAAASDCALKHAREPACLCALPQSNPQIRKKAHRCEVAGTCAGRASWLCGRGWFRPPD